MNYLAADRPDIQYATKEACRDMSKPTQGSWRRILRIGRYLCGRPRLIWRFDLQNEQLVVDAFSDANWAGCRHSRKSTSGGVLKIGMHPIKSWAKTQATIAKSSAESELYGIVRGTCEALGFMTLSEDLGRSLKARMHMDATAAQGIIDRVGLSKVRHIDVNNLWLQEQLTRELVPLTKIPGPHNCADLMTKHVPAELIERHTKAMSLEFREGRSDKAVNLQSIYKKMRQVESSEKLIAATERYSDNKGNDCWQSRGAGGRWTRVHRTPRRSFFTPCRVARGPAHPDELCCDRITRGVDSSGKSFEVRDDWMNPKSAHALRDKPWTGVTEFVKRPSK